MGIRSQAAFRSLAAATIAFAFAPAGTLAGLEATGAPEEPVELFHLIFEGAVSIEPAPGGGTCARGWSNPDPIPTACLPDPHSLICGSIERPVLEKARRLETRLRPYHDRLGQATDQAVAATIRELGPIPAPGASGRARYRRRFAEAIARQLGPAAFNLNLDLFKDLTPSRAQVAANVNRARGIFLRALGRANGLGPDQRRILERVLSCVRNPQIKGFDTERNAAIFKPLRTGQVADRAHEQLGDGMDLVLTDGLTAGDFFANGSGFRRRVNPLLASVGGCMVLLSAKTWIDCAEGGPACFTTLFHEIGHLVTSCTYRDLAARARDTSAELTYGSGATRVMGFLSRQADSLASALEDNASCLATLSSPREAILNGCDGPEGTSSRIRSRCGLGAHHGYPSQWNEAEADFWGATATALWLEETYADPAARAHAIYESTAQWCADSTLEHARPRPTHPDVKRANALLEEPEDCEREFAAARAPAVAAWKDPHQDWATRINRNVLRNDDLRRALGCPSRPEVPMSCSPRGVVRTRIPAARE